MHSAERTIDFSKKFLPEELTPLFHTDGYDLLNAEQQLRYNQLHGLYFNEQIMFFERSFARTLLTNVLSEPLPEALRSGVRQFMLEEEEHSAMFQSLNETSAPQYYSRQPFYFIKVPPVAQTGLQFISSHPKWFPAFLWLMHLQEERALFFARKFLEHKEELEPAFVEAQRKHLADEVGHVRWDRELIERLWPGTPSWLRGVNVRFLAWMIGEYFSAPKRAGVRVLDALVRDRTELAPKHQQLRQCLLDLERDQEYRVSFYSPHNVPETLKRFDAWPEFRVLATVMPGYVPQMATTL